MAPGSPSPRSFLIGWLRAEAEAEAAMEEAGSEEAEELRRFLEQHRALHVLPPGTRVRCTLTGHELPCQLPALRSYTAGKKYQRLTAEGLPGQGGEEGKEGGSGGDGGGDGGLFGPHLVPSTKNPRQLFCRLTLRHINRIPAHVLRHVQGRRFQKALRNYEKCQREGVEYVPSCCRRRQKQPRKTPSEGLQHSHPRRKGGFWEPPDSDDSGSDTEDSMSDLYPPELFQEKSPAGKESNHDFATDSDEEVAMPATQNGCENNSEASGTDQQMGTKRGKKQDGGLKKRFKSRNKKPKRFGKAVGGK